MNGKYSYAVDAGQQELLVSHSGFAEGDFRISFLDTTFRKDLKPGHLYLVCCDKDISQTAVTELGPMERVAPVLYAFMMEVR